MSANVSSYICEREPVADLQVFLCISSMGPKSLTCSPRTAQLAGWSASVSSARPLLWPYTFHQNIGTIGRYTPDKLTLCCLFVIREVTIRHRKRLPTSRFSTAAPRSTNIQSDIGSDSRHRRCAHMVLRRPLAVLVLRWELALHSTMKDFHNWKWSQLRKRVSNHISSLAML